MTATDIKNATPHKKTVHTTASAVAPVALLADKKRASPPTKRVATKSVTPLKSPNNTSASAHPTAKAVPKTKTRPAAIPVPKVAEKLAVQPKTEKLIKAKKPKLVRDSFTIPKAEYTVLDDLKQRATVLNSAVKKSELIRAGIKALAAMSDSAFLATLKRVPTLKTGRPNKVKGD